MEQSTLAVKEAAKYLGVSEWLLYEMVRKKEVPHVRIRSRIFFRTRALDEWMTRQEKANFQEEEVEVHEVQMEQPVVPASFRLLGGNKSPVRRLGGR